MRIAIISDTHGDQSALLRALKKAGPVDIVLHLGDHGSDLTAATGLFKECYAVSGNSDPKRNLPEELLLNFCGHTLFICHGHRYGVKQGLQRLFYRGLDIGADIVLFGHTHQAVQVEEEGLLVLNPGSAGRPYPGDRPSFALLDLDEGARKAEIRYF